MRRREFLGLAGAGVCGLAATNVFGATTPKHPNFVFIQGEAQGWTSMSVPMDDRISNSVSELFYTPNLADWPGVGCGFQIFMRLRRDARLPGPHILRERVPQNCI